MTAAGVADRPRRAGVGGGRRQRVVAALAVGQPDRVDRRQVDDVEAELGEPWQLALDSLQPAPRSREQLVPGAESGPQAVNLDHHRLLQRHPAVARLVALDGREQLLAERDIVLGAVRHRGIGELTRGVLDQPAVLGRVGLPRGLAQQHDTLGELTLEPAARSASSLA